MRRSCGVSENKEKRNDACEYSISCRGKQETENIGFDACQKRWTSSMCLFTREGGGYTMPLSTASSLPHSYTAREVLPLKSRKTTIKNHEWMIALKWERLKYMY